MSAGGKTPDREAVARVRAVLRSDVAAVLREALPTLEGLGDAAVYDAVLDDPALLEAAFHLCRAEPERFHALLRDAQGRRVSDDAAPLSCGRSLRQIMAMALRSAARRHFRRCLGGTVAAARAEMAPGPLGRMRRWLGPPRRAVRRPSQPGPGDRLYHAMSDLLRHDWQARLIPAYAHLPERLVRDLGERLLDFRQPEEIHALARGLPPSAIPGLAAPTVAAAEPPGPAPEEAIAVEDMIVPVAATGLPATRQILREDDVHALYHGAALRRRLEVSDPRAEVQLLAAVTAVSPEVVRMLEEDLGMGLLQEVVTACACAATLGPGRFLALFCAPPNPEAVDAWKTALAQAAVGEAPTLDAMVIQARRSAVALTAMMSARKRTLA